jgi:hypothetical protein
VDYGLPIADLKNFLKNIKIRNQKSEIRNIGSSALWDFGVSDQERAYGTARYFSKSNSFCPS